MLIYAVSLHEFCHEQLEQTHSNMITLYDTSFKILYPLENYGKKSELLQPTRAITYIQTSLAHKFCIFFLLKKIHFDLKIFQNSEKIVHFT